jgi:hypothetical protein
MTSRVWNSTIDSRPRLLVASEVAGFLVLIVVFLATIYRLDSDQLIPASCLAGGLTGAVLILSRFSPKRPAVLLGGTSGSLAPFLIAKAIAVTLDRHPIANLPREIVNLPRVLPGTLVFGLEGLLLGAAVTTLVQTADHLRLPFGLIVFVVWGLFFVAYAYWLC